MSTRCPFCKTSLSGLFRGLVEKRREHGIEDVTTGTICHECGEPLIAEATGFRRPDATEYVDIATEPQWDQARRCWLEVKRQREAGGPMPMQASWEDFNANALRGLNDMLDREGSGEKELKMLRLIFHSGALATLNIIENDLERADGRAQMVAVLAVHKAELDAVFQVLMAKLKGEHA